ncbi:MAG: outer membrane protein transport protein [Desulfobulbus sp.]|nr:outer membrane protein transport protein [Desulfobulbus sp.]
MMNKRMMHTISALAVLGLSGQSWAGGLYLYELGTEDLGLANAGSAARAQDASIVANNPAGMTRLQGNQLTLGAQLLYADLDYTLENPNLNNSGNTGGWMPGASTFYSHSVNDDLKLGMALYGNFGASLDFGDTWAGRHLVKEITLMGLTVQPSLAYRLNNTWSVGAGLGLNYGIFSLTRDRVRDGGEVESDDTDIAWNGKVGLLFEPAEHTRLGLVYTSKVDYSFDVDRIGTLPASDGSWILPINLTVDAPQQVMFSAVQVLNDKWSLLGEMGWQDWSSLSEEVSAGRVTQPSKVDVQDTWHGALGVQYQLTTDTRLNVGLAYDSSMYNDQDSISLTMPSGASWRIGTGVQHQLNDRSSLGAAVLYLLSEDGSVASPIPLAGSYDDPRMYFFSCNYSYRF